MEAGRNIAAIVVGVIILLLVVLLAKWTGEQIRGRFLTPRPPAVTTLIPEETEETTPTSTASAIPATGPADLGYMIIGLAVLFGFSSLALAHKRS